MADLHDRKATVLLHPSELSGDDENAPLHPWAEYPMDLARSWIRLVLNDTLTTYPDIDWILTHAGGGVPFMAERLGKVYYLRNGKLKWGRILLDLALHRDGGLALAEGVAYDTVGAANPVVHAALDRLVGPDSIRFGSNFPFDSEDTIRDSLRFLADHPWGQKVPSAVGGNQEN
jgi:predicted TIM-barrel fold metal-dependent hydrolase